MISISSWSSRAPTTTERRLAQRDEAFEKSAAERRRDGGHDIVDQRRERNAHREQRFECRAQRARGSSGKRREDLHDLAARRDKRREHGFHDGDGLAHDGPIFGRN